MNPTIGVVRTLHLDMPIDQVKDFVVERSGNLCEICGRNEAREFYLRKHPEQGGKWLPSNCLHLCTWCLHYVGHFRTGYYGLGWCVREDANPAEVPVQLNHGPTYGQYLLDDNGDYTDAYPVGEAI